LLLLFLRDLRTVRSGICVVISRLCEYQTLNAPTGLARSSLVTDQATIERLTAEADSGYRPPSGTAQSCPVDLGTIADVYFAYEVGPVLLLQTDLGGCSPAVDSFGWAEAPQLAESLRQLLPPDFRIPWGHLSGG
jgi:hypothetical protein